MIDSKPLIIYSKMSKAQKTLFKKYILQSLYIKHKEIRKLFVYLFSKRSISNQAFSKEKVFQHLYPQNKTYNDDRMRYIIHLASKVIEDFLIINTAQQDEFIHEELLLKSYEKLNLFEYTFPLLSSMEKGIKASHHISDQYYHQLFTIEAQRYQLDNKNIRDNERDFSNIFNYLNQYYFLQYLKYACIYKNNENILPTGFSLELIDTILEVSANHTYHKNIPIQIYSALWLLLSTTQEASFLTELEQKIIKNEKYFTAFDYQDIWLILINYCIKKQNAGDIIYTQKGYEYYRYALQKKYLIENGELDRFTYFNIIQLALKLKKNKEADAIAEQYKNAINEVYREDAYWLSKARVYMAQKQYKKAMPILLEVKFKDATLHIGGKFILIKIYYELGEWEPLHSLLNSFRIDLHRKRNLGYQKEYYRTALSYVRKMIKARTLHKKGVKALLKEIQEVPTLPERNWFIEQMEALC